MGESSSNRSAAATAVFFRDDDAGALNAPLRAVVELLLAERVPCNYQIVPAHLSPEAAEYLCERSRAHPELLRLNQHGYEHRHTLGGQPTFAEFSGDRSYQDQHAAIAKGRAILERMLGDQHGPKVFTPPCHKYDRNTLQALEALGFTVFSAGVKGSPAAQAYYAVGRALGRITLLGKRVSYHGARIPSTGLVELSGAIDVDEQLDRTGRKIVKSASALEQELRNCLAARPAVLGVMLHHDNYVDDAKLETLRAFIGVLRREPSVRFANLESIAASMTDSGAILRDRSGALGSAR